jgi:uncharacterized circularly permuted ATP-grasp superfamily protein
MFRREMFHVNGPEEHLHPHLRDDLIRARDGTYMVLEDNGRTPSGVSYVLENRAVMKRVFPMLFSAYRVRAIEDYPSTCSAHSSTRARATRPTRPSSC